MHQTIFMNYGIFLLSMLISIAMSVTLVSIAVIILIKKSSNKYKEVLTDVLDYISCIIESSKVQCNHNPKENDNEKIQGTLVGIDMSDPKNPKICKKNIDIDKNTNISSIIQQVVKEEKEKNATAITPDSNIPPILERVQKEMEEKTYLQKNYPKKEDDFMPRTKKTQWSHGEVNRSNYFYWDLKRKDGNHILIRTKATYVKDSSSIGMFNIWLNKRAIWIDRNTFKKNYSEFNLTAVEHEKDIIKIKSWYLNN